MVIWFIVGSIVCILGVLFMLAIFKGGHKYRGHEYERKLHFRSMVNTYRRFGKKRSEEDYKKKSMPTHK